MRHWGVLRVGLTGGMGAGKSTAAAILRDCGAVLIDSDVIAREVVAPGTPGLAALVEAFGGDILASDKSLDRAALAAKAFADEQSRKTLNSITHPLVGERTAELLAASPSDAIVVQDVPLLVENHMQSMFHLVIAVVADVEERVRRLVAHRGVAEADARARIATQASDEQRRAAADVLIDNGGASGAIDPVVRSLFQDRLTLFERNMRENKRVPAQYRLATPDPSWDAQARRLIGRLGLACGADALRIDHIGSTAVPGLPAKDVIDIQVTVADLTVADTLRDRLGQAGFPHIAHIVHDDPKPTPADPEGVDLALWGKRIHGSADPGRPAQVHLRAAGSPGQQFALVFREWLRAEPTVRAEYLTVKREAEARAAGHIGHDAAVAYLGVKTPWFDRAYPRALEWAARHRPGPGADRGGAGSSG